MNSINDNNWAVYRIQRITVGFLLMLITGIWPVTAIESEKTMNEHGFRYNLSEWLENNISVEGALCRKIVNGKMTKRDKEILKAEASRIKAEMSKFIADNKARNIGEQLLKIHELGIADTGDTIVKALKTIHVNIEQDISKMEHLSILNVGALLAFGDTGNYDEITKAGLDFFTKSGYTKWVDPWTGCPWNNEITWRCLWEASELPDLRDMVNKGIKKAIENLTPAGLCKYNSTFGYIQALGYIDSKEAKELLVRLLPMILETQKMDGSWGMDFEGTHGSSLGRTVDVIRALVKHGLLKEINSRPGLPTVCKVVKEISLEMKDVQFMQNVDSIVYLFSSNDKTLYGIIPETGEVNSRIKLDVGDIESLILHGGKVLATYKKNPPRLLEINVADGKVLREREFMKLAWANRVDPANGKLLIRDAYHGMYWKIDDFKGEETPVDGNSPVLRTKETYWTYDLLSDCIVRRNLAGDMFEFFGNPLETELSTATGTGKTFSLLDGKNGRIVIVQRRNGKPRPAAIGYMGAQKRR